MSAPLRPGVPGLTPFLGIDIVYYSQAEIDGDARAEIIDPAPLSHYTVPDRLPGTHVAIAPKSENMPIEHATSPGV